MPSTAFVPPDHDPYKSMQEWVAWDDASGLAEDSQREAADWVASWGRATLTVVASVLPVISILVAVAVSH
jgi:hypothetical protein